MNPSRLQRSYQLGYVSLWFIAFVSLLVALYFDAMELTKSHWRQICALLSTGLLTQTILVVSIIYNKPFQLNSNTFTPMVFFIINITFHMKLANIERKITTDIQALCIVLDVALVIIHSSQAIYEHRNVDYEVSIQEASTATKGASKQQSLVHDLQGCVCAFIDRQSKFIYCLVAMLITSVFINGFLLALVRE
ncbi:hypothetical protein ACOME3_003391 [Neoechinorhynchus agilis]